ncbi:MAG: hypothetical protein LUB61_02005, partial [Eggerthellaceae bacterium]|nr:hypothetical protein [Eggerthellaceae bacterium]
MQLPLDIPALLQSVTHLNEATETPISISMYIDETASGELVGCVRGDFTSSSPTTRLTINYINDHPLPVTECDDMAVIIAAYGPDVGAQAELLRKSGTPVMIATNIPAVVNAYARIMNHPIPVGDIVAPDTPAPNADGKQPAVMEEG